MSDGEITAICKHNNIAMSCSECAEERRKAAEKKDEEN